MEHFNFSLYAVYCIINLKTEKFWWNLFYVQPCSFLYYHLSEFFYLLPFLNHLSLLVFYFYVNFPLWCNTNIFKDKAYHLMTAGGFPYLETQEIIISCPSFSVRVAPRMASSRFNSGFLGGTGTRIRVHLDKLERDKNCYVWVWLPPVLLPRLRVMTVILSLRALTGNS